MEQATEVTKAKVIIRPDTSKMVKTKGGSYHTDDFIGNALAGLTVDQVIVIGTEMGIDASKYSHLNRGQIRMTIGTALRKLAKDGEGDDAAKIGNLSDSFRAGNEKDAAEKAAAKEAVKAEKAAAKEAKPKKEKKAKVADDAEGEGDAE